jgi:hypothetical protein
VEDFDAAIEHLGRYGYAEDAPEETGRMLLVRRHGPAGFPQVYMLDPDGHIVELNARA